MRAKLLAVGAAFGLLAMLPADAKKAKLPLTHVSCGQSIQMSIRLANSLNGCAEHGLVIDNVNVTLDLNGQHITGNGMDDDNGLTEIGVLALADGARVKNGSVSGFEVGVTIEGADAKVVRVRSLGNVAGMRVIGADVLVKKSSASFNDSAGIIVDAPGGNILKSRFEGNEWYGVAFSAASAGSKLVKSTATGNSHIGAPTREAGIWIFANDVLVKDSVSNANALFGVLVENVVSDIKFRGSEFSYNGRHGVSLEGGNSFEFNDNTAKRNGFFNGISNGVGLGFDLSAGTDVTGRGNNAKGNDDPNQCEPAFVCD